ncbi:MAG: cytochrome P450 [Aphanothece sp. CMT-3BRIN-NPC111]|nr:cytochrome P450 [Aphanothece sp. CMT-3BRIN-NPC111]
MKLPDGPQTPALLQTMQWIGRPLAFMDACAQRYGDIFTTRVVGNSKPLVFISNPQAIQEIFTADSKQFEAPGNLNGILRPLLGDQGVILLEGDRHRKRRQLLMPPFHGDRMRAYSQLILDITDREIGKWEIGKPFSIRSSMQEITLQVILQAVFGLHEGERFQQLKQLLCSLLNVTASPISSSLLFFKFLQQDLGPWSPWGSFLRQRQQVDELLYQEIRERREQPDSSRTDILSLLMSARDEQGQPMTDVELRDELMTLLVAGHETTATALAWAFYWIHKLPEVHDQLLDELDSLGDDPDPNTVARLPYLNAVCSETLRIYPVALITFPRSVKSARSLMGYDLEPGTILAGCIYLTHHREDLYPEPHRFQPQRFLERQFSPYEYLPFGGGSRRCIGMAFAQMEMKLVLARVLSHLQLAVAEPRPVQPVRRGVTLSPAGGVRMVVTGKRPQNTRRLQTISRTAS